MSETFRIVFSNDNLWFMGKGLLMTIFLSVAVVFLSLILGAILGILRNYVKGIGRISGMYIEIFRNTPLLLWMFACIFLIPSKLVPSATLRGALALFLYTSAVIAEIVRGGLNSIPQGQFEAAKSQGFNFVQTLWYIIMPQCLHHIIPSLLSQIITTIKDTSFLAGFGILEFFRTGQIIMGQNLTGVTKTAQTFLIFGILALIYFVICFSLSCVVRDWKKRNVDVTR